VKRLILALAAVAIVLAACNRNAAETPAASVPAPAASASTTPAPMPMPPAAATPKTATATGVVKSIDPVAKTITIEHGPVESLGWPGMTMAFKAPDSDLSAVRVGDNVTFEFISSGMDGTIVTLSKQ